MSTREAQDDRCPHCNHKYWRSTFKECPNCGRHHAEPVGSPTPPTPQVAAQTAFEDQPRDARIEGMIRRIADDQARIAADTSSMKLALWILVVWLVLIPLAAALFLLAR